MSKEPREMPILTAVWAFRGDFESQMRSFCVEERPPNVRLRHASSDRSPADHAIACMRYPWQQEPAAKRAGSLRAMFQSCRPGRKLRLKTSTYTARIE